VVRVSAGRRSAPERPRIVYFAAGRRPGFTDQRMASWGRRGTDLSTILLVEDTIANRALVVKLLKAAGHEVIEAADGEAGIAEAQANRPDLVLMDISLPGIDGWEALRRLRADDRTRDLRIVALTAHAMAGTREEALAAGFDGYMSKPIDAVTFAETVSRFVGEKGE
jgi:two-component system, cell cycle response regulator DivK